ncbi:MAG: lipopolysaccharide heptosyltransferase II [Gammaproteobacteria bacterium]|nr:lipopolysaccharide heptosyltransferase II [Gammaproteobacteria bacterium]NNF61440.1 lipopolysaccharide heptosyltransferase II [Gammaproteobacteria bacterium]NNM20185.1 lipopolysaccharide heptosyltransferase II [Gammaproteobacteria bacterium]
MVMMHSLCRLLRQRNADIVIDVLAPGWSLPVIGRMNEVREGIESPFAHGVFDWPGRHRLGKSLRDRAYGQAIILPRSFKSALIPFHAGVPVRTGYRGEMRFGFINDMRDLDKQRLTTTVARYAALGLPADTGLPGSLPQPRLRVDPENQASALARLGLQTDRPVVGLVPGAEYGPAKQWPVEYFAELAGTLHRDGCATWVFGSDKDRDLGEQIRAGSGDVTQNLCGRTSLPDAIDLIALTRQVVCNDSGLMHIAAAAGTAVAAIYGSSSPDYTPPLTDRAVVIRTGIECSPCFDRTCRYGHYRCLRDIQPQQLIAAMKTLA